jgi:hypothetical protein
VILEPQERPLEPGKGAFVPAAVAIHARGRPGRD